MTETFTENLVYEERAFYRLNHRTGPNRTEDIISSVLMPWILTSEDSKQVTMDSHQRVLKIQNFYLKEIK